MIPMDVYVLLVTQNTEHSKGPCVLIHGGDNHDQVSDGGEETRTGNDETVGLETVSEISKHNGCDHVWRVARTHRLYESVDNLPRRCNGGKAHLRYPKVFTMEGRNAEMLAKAQLRPK